MGTKFRIQVIITPEQQLATGATLGDSMGKTERRFMTLADGSTTIRELSKEIAQRYNDRYGHGVNEEYKVKLLENKDRFELEDDYIVRDVLESLDTVNVVGSAIKVSAKSKKAKTNKGGDVAAATAEAKKRKHDGSTTSEPAPKKMAKVETVESIKPTAVPLTIPTTATTSATTSTVDTPEKISKRQKKKAVVAESSATEAAPTKEVLEKKEQMAKKSKTTKENKPAPKETTQEVNKLGEKPKDAAKNTPKEPSTTTPATATPSIHAEATPKKKQSKKKGGTADKTATTPASAPAPAPASTPTPISAAIPAVEVTPKKKRAKKAADANKASEGVSTPTLEVGTDSVSETALEDESKIMKVIAAKAKKNLELQHKKDIAATAAVQNEVATKQIKKEHVEATTNTKASGKKQKDAEQKSATDTPTKAKKAKKNADTPSTATIPTAIATPVTLDEIVKNVTKRGDTMVEITSTMDKEEQHLAKLHNRRVKDAAAREANSEETNLTQEQIEAKAKHEKHLADRRLHAQIVREAKRIVQEAEAAGQAVDPAVREYVTPKKRNRGVIVKGEEQEKEIAGASSTMISPSPTPTASSETSTVVGEDKAHAAATNEKMNGTTEQKKKKKQAAKKEKETPVVAEKKTPVAKKTKTKATTQEEDDEMVDELMEDVSEPEVKAAAVAPVPAAVVASSKKNVSATSSVRGDADSSSDSSSDSDSESSNDKDVELPVAPPMVVSAVKKAKGKAAKKTA
ncbi:hypothetical protein BG004_005915 [Podila humilis]|nr:hypothetical protein BG004_005915 [Podila humilis]